MTPRGEDELVSFDLNYVTITRAPHPVGPRHRRRPRAAGIVQTAGGFHSASGAARNYHRLPHHLPAEEQRHGATAAAHALLLAGYSVQLAPSPNTLTAPDGDRQAARRYLAQLESRARAAETDRDVAALLTEIAAPEEGVLAQAVRSLISTWATWGKRRREAGLDEEPAEQLMESTSSLSNHTRRITLIRDQAAPHTTSSAPSTRRR
ncbi:hypothetical protein ACFWDI_33850 [Streptomyces sp. NPDC060064]|uniref:hypothetical protein n=1 Tax=Streptomyces sp. NPDC060064 TaxID=3347049 RepID=UPI0036B03305